MWARKNNSCCLTNKQPTSPQPTSSAGVPSALGTAPEWKHRRSSWRQAGQLLPSPDRRRGNGGVARSPGPVSSEMRCLSKCCGWLRQYCPWFMMVLQVFDFLMAQKWCVSCGNLTWKFGFCSCPGGAIFRTVLPGSVLEPRLPLVPKPQGQTTVSLHCVPLPSHEAP
jgi:hypothetical protein